MSPFRIKVIYLQGKIKSYTPTQNTGKYSVYEGVDPNTGEVKYVEITKRDPDVRIQEHKN